MSVDQIAKRYTQALLDGASKEELLGYKSVFSSLAEALKDEKVKSVIYSPYMESAELESILLDAVKSAKSDKVNNMIKLLVEKRRVNTIGAISNTLTRLVADQEKSYDGKIFSSSKVAGDTVKTFETNIGKRVDAKVSFEAVEDSYNGLKVEVEDLGIEASFSKSNVRNQMIQHILKSI